MTLTIETLAEAMQNAVIRDDEGEFPRLFDLLGFSGENKARTVTRSLAAAVLTAIEQAGYVVVPREATEAMVDAWVEADWPEEDGMSQSRRNALAAQADWSAMLSAAPKSEGE